MHNYAVYGHKHSHASVLIDCSGTTCIEKLQVVTDLWCFKWYRSSLKAVAEKTANELF